MDESLIDAVHRRAYGVCEYCRLPHWLHPGPFEVEHIIAVQHGGRTILGNLAYACLHCNRHKGPNLAGIDPMTRKLTPLFHPRRHKWEHHFRWVGPLLLGRTAIGRTTVVVLAMNALMRVAVRKELINEGLFPPKMGN
jgi:hypothetical protein